MGVMGGGGESGVGLTMVGARNGEDAIGVAEGVFLARRERCDRLDGVGDEVPGVAPGVLLGVLMFVLDRTPPPTSNSMLPRSLPYAGGGASVPTLGASPHFFTLASINTNPACPRLT
jgi:hypothetical protein